MVINTQTTLVMRCPECGRLEHHGISRFALVGARSSLHIHCSCGALKLSLTSQGNKVNLQVPCVVCGASHTLLVNAHTLWSSGNIELFCQTTGLELGYLGAEDQVHEQARLEETLNGLDFMVDNFFHNQEVMSAVLKHMHNLGKAGRLYCECGNQRIEVDIFPDRLELHCSRCDNLYIVYAETQKDLDAIGRTWKIELTRHTFAHLGKTRETPPQL
ncbi:hypothetical protein G7K71_07535 [Desulfofundulus sp. TPOSR]|uniref:Uncharacterized protein n=1 Tax=Desulfofundulus kuznetsovii (strain DSM 6115 / VKM B-1805 / 17) TaxID=760568 RepID=A0AAU8PKZ8_DESK7|nr:hypothetical protein [Desulfofundulus sp. TPOSR]AEG16942.1 hypothetical protein Desku_3462 [Desulfofundulus kuznetsovii DSM 6115]NHM26835.1 hypothetical protein [Desulfofundulus sp. TPOSR]